MGSHVSSGGPFRVGVSLLEAHTGAPRGRSLPLSSSALTQTPDIHVKEPLQSGRRSHLTCSMPGACDGAMPFTIFWAGAAVRPLGLDLVDYNSSEILLTPRPQDHGTNLTCRVTFPRTGVRTERTLTLNVSCECAAWIPGGGGGCRKDVELFCSISHFCVSWAWRWGKGQL